ncbi:hypothetical protein HDV00_008252 [Rhizophlyctis rosea]|nr:hypothetical protein HDV00_008252 [Rhizophlyctis rosea]
MGVFLSFIWVIHLKLTTHPASLHIQLHAFLSSLVKAQNEAPRLRNVSLFNPVSSHHRILANPIQNLPRLQCLLITWAQNGARQNDVKNIISRAATAGRNIEIIIRCCAEGSKARKALQAVVKFDKVEAPTLSADDL